MARKKGQDALWKQLGLKQVFSRSGKTVKGYTDAEGNYFSERQFRKKFAAAPMVGTPKPKTEVDKIKREVDRAFNQIEQAAKKPGMTLEWFLTGKPPAPPKDRTLEEHNKFIDSYRKDAIEFKKMAGVLDKKEARAALDNLKQEIKWRGRAMELNEAMWNASDRKERLRLRKEYIKATQRYEEAHKKLLKKGIMSDEDEPNAKALRYMYYHP